MKKSVFLGAVCALYSGAVLAQEQSPGANPAGFLKPEQRRIVDESLKRADEFLQESAVYQPLLDEYRADANAVGSLSLSDAIRVALGRDIDLALSKSRVSEADEQRRSALHGYLPRVSLLGEFGSVNQDVIETDNQVFQQGKTGFGTTRFQGEIVLPVFDLGQYRAIQAADTGRATARAAVNADAHDAVFRTATAYLRALQSRSQLDGVARRIDLLEQQQENENKREQTGYGKSDGANLIAIEIGAAYAERISYESHYAQALTALSRYVGRAVNELKPVPAYSSMLETRSAESIRDLIRSALQANPSIELQRLQTLRAEQAFAGQWADDFLPKLELFYRAEHEDREASRFGGGSVTFDQTLGLQVRVPIYNATGQGYRSREERVRLRQSILREANLRRELEAEIGTLLPRLDIERQAWQAALRVVEASRELVSSAEKASGRGFATDMLVLRQSLQAALAQSRADQAWYAYLSTRVRLSYLLGESIEAMF